MSKQKKIELEELIEECPHLFDDKYNNFGCGPGWVPIITQVCKLVHSQITDVWCTLTVPQNNVICDKLPNGLIEFKFQQIKEKFGGLRLYYYIKTKPFAELEDSDKVKFSESNYNSCTMKARNNIAGIISMAEAIAGITCEETGYPGSRCVPKEGGWIKTFSPEQAAKVGYILEDDFDPASPAAVAEKARWEETTT